MFFGKPRKKELDITDALTRKEATITIGGQPVVVRAFKLAQALALFAALGNVKELLELAGNDMAAFNRALLAKLPQLLAFCVPDTRLDPAQITLSEFADLLMAVWCVNDLERILANFITGNCANAHTNAGFGGIAKAINEYFGVKVEDLTPTQINAYVLEIAKAQKAQQQAQRGPEININAATPLQDLKQMGVKLKTKKKN